MASIIFFLLLSTFLMAAAQQRQYNISLGSSRTPTNNSSWLSPSGLYAFGFYKQGNGYAVGIFLAGIRQKTVVWTANRDDPPVSSNATLLFTSEGRLVLQTTQVLDTSIADSSLAASSASLFDSGNLVLYNSDQEIIWQSFEKPTDTLLPGQRLLAGAELISSVSEADQSSWIFRLAMQHDGHLVQYPIGTPNTAPYSYWASGTNGMGDNVTLNLDDDGHLYLLNATSYNIKDLTTGGNPTEETIYLMRIDADGIFRLYSHNLRQNGSWSVVWNSSNEKCDPKGLCGLNGFCVSIDQDAECRCVPGFAFVSQGNWTSGCERDFVAESCKNRNESIRYSIEALDNTIWEDVPYSTLSLPVKEDCAQACLEDCNCEAALFNDGMCTKQRLPLRFGRRQNSQSNMAFIKVGKLTPSADNIVPKESKKEIRKEILIISVSFAAFGSSMLAIFAIVIYKYNVWSYKRIPNNIGNLGLIEDVAPKSFTYAEIEKMTDGFKEEVGRGASGTVYKGAMKNGRKEVAVKRLEKSLIEGEREFQNEMKVIGRTHHRNLVRLLGYSFDGPNKLLVYEYMSNGSLADVLFTSERKLCWDERMGIARGIARGILYLHEECETQIIHCDIKPHNIVMDEYMRPKISDFGLAKLLKQNQTKTFTAIRGTRGYVAPEWHRKLPVTVKVDVYSFGIVLLEIICFRRNVDQSLPDEEAILEEWVYRCLQDGDLGKLVGDEEVDKREFERMVKVGIWCILDEPSLRPSMKKVLLMLEGTVDIPIPPSPSSFFSAI